MTMNKRIIIAALLLTSMSAAAQDTYENARALGSDLNGTARYVGMGGALDALGAEISTISTNPAAIGLFRHSMVSMSLGVVSQQDAHKFDNVGKTNPSFDQIGFVYSMQAGPTSFLNFGVNYHKSRNFDQILSATNSLYQSSLSKHIVGKSTLGSDLQGGYFLDTNKDKEWIGWRNNSSSERAYPYTQLDYMYTNAVTMDDVNNKDSKGNIIPTNTYEEASAYNFDRAHSGWISDFDFNISGNINNRFYLGITMGLHYMNYKGYSVYSENVLDAGNKDIGQYTLTDERKITGTGFDVKLGFIFRPIAESPFRVGLSVTTPTWYELKSENFTTLRNAADPIVHNYGGDSWKSSESLKYLYYTPWKFGASLGHTIGNYLALGASYEYSDCSSADTRVIDGYDEFDNRESHSDRVMNSNTEHSLKGVHTLKLGAEFKPETDVAIRLGYNYVSPMYQKNGVRDNMLDSEGNCYSSTADYTNWSDTNRFTCGLGFRFDKINFDIAYQYSVTNGTFHPFQDTSFIESSGAKVTNIGTTTDVSNKRHQLLFTLGYTF